MSYRPQRVWRACSEVECRGAALFTAVARAMHALCVADGEALPAQGLQRRSRQAWGSSEKIPRYVCTCGFGQSAALQRLAIATATAALYAWQPILIRSAH